VNVTREQVENVIMFSMWCLTALALGWFLLALAGVIR